MRRCLFIPSAGSIYQLTLPDHTALIDELQDLLGVPVDVVSVGALREGDEAIRAEALPV